MKKTISVAVAIAITFIAMTVTFSITMIVSMNIFDNAVNDVIEKQAQYNKISELDKYVRSNFYGDIDDQLLNDRMAQGFISGLNDPNSSYYTAEEYALMQDLEAGRIVGIGLVGAKDASTGYFRVIKVYADSPAAAAGIEEGMRILEIDGTSTRLVNTANGLERLLRDEPGTTVTLQCERGNDELTFEVQRTNYTTPTVESHIVDNVGYIRIYAFTAETFSDFDFAVREAESAGAIGFVFDLRNTATGQIDYAFDMIDMLCPLGYIAQAQMKNGVVRSLRMSDAENYMHLPMVCLVNEGTSGTAELFAACVRDLGGGQLVGTRTAGQGSLQRAPQQLVDGSAVSVTYALLLAAESQESFNGTGLVPELEVAFDYEDIAALYVPQFVNDSQLRRAMVLVNSLARAMGIEAPVIMDVPLPEDTSGTESDGNGEEGADGTDGAEGTDEGGQTDGEGTSSDSAGGDSQDGGE